MGTSAADGCGGFPVGQGQSIEERGRPRQRADTLSEAQPLVTSRNNSHPSVFRLPRAYVQACGKGTLALYFEEGRVVFRSLACGSWSCPHCRPRLSARILDRLRRGMESRPGHRRTFLTLTIDPSKFGAVRIGSNKQADGRWTQMVSEPKPEQFDQAVQAMSKEWDRLAKRLAAKASRAEAEKFGFFRVIELHRNGWPHYHVVLEHPEFGAEDIRRQVSGWKLGRFELKPIDLDGAVGELAPYLVSAERKSGGHKAYQFAATALPANFRLYQPSRGFLAPEAESDGPRAVHGVPLRGHFTGYHQQVRDWGGESQLLLSAPSEGEHVPPSGSQAMGDAAVVLYAELVDQAALHAPPRWYTKLSEALDQFDR